MSVHQIFGILISNKRLFIYASISLSMLFFQLYLFFGDSYNKNLLLLQSEKKYIKYSKILNDKVHAVFVVSNADFINRKVAYIKDIDSTIDRDSLLRSLFKDVTSAEFNDYERVKSWVRYLQDRIAHPKWAPLLDNGQAVYDPYWIIKNRLGHCGQTNRVVVDGLLAVGYNARLVQLKAHVGAEVFIDDKWRYLDADWLHFGQFVYGRDGRIASAIEIYHDNLLLSKLKPDAEFKFYEVNVLHDDAESYTEMFSVRPYYYVKTATKQQSKNEYYGWNYYKKVSD